MAIKKHYEITCDGCGNADHYQGSILQANEDAKSNGWIVKGNKHFCDLDCENQYAVEKAEKLLKQV